MKKALKSAIVSGAALAMWGGSSLAADIAPAASDWTGFYFGAGGGGAVNYSDTDASGYAIAAFENLESEFQGTGPLEDADSGEVFGYGEFDCISLVNAPNDCGAVLYNAATIGKGQLGSPGENFSLAQDIVDLINDQLFDGAQDLGPLGRADGDSNEMSAFGTVEGGFDFQLGSRFLVGLNGAFNIGSASIGNSASSGPVAAFDTDLGVDGTGEVVVPDADGLGLLKTDLDLGNSWSVGGRAGFLASDGILLFASGGFVSTDAELKASYESDAGINEDLGTNPQTAISALAQTNASSSQDEWMNGYYVGGGVEALLTQNASFKLEYRFSDLGSIRTSAAYEGAGEICATPPGVGCTDYEAATGVKAEASPYIHALRATVNWRF